MMRSVVAKLGNMRKEQEFSVYPYNEGDKTIKIQSDKRIALIEVETGKTILSKQIQNGAFNHHLMPQLGAMITEVSQEFVQECLGNAPKSGDQVLPGCNAVIIG